jgi:hypothetical protein
MGWPCEMGRVVGAGELLRRGLGSGCAGPSPNLCPFLFLLSLILVFSLTNLLFLSTSVYCISVYSFWDYLVAALE